MRNPVLEGGDFERDWSRLFIGAHFGTKVVFTLGHALGEKKSVAQVRPPTQGLEMRTADLLLL